LVVGRFGGRPFPACRPELRRPPRQLRAPERTGGRGAVWTGEQYRRRLA